MEPVKNKPDVKSQTVRDRTSAAKPAAKTAPGAPAFNHMLRETEEAPPVTGQGPSLSEPRGHGSTDWGTSEPGEAASLEAEAAAESPLTGPVSLCRAAAQFMEQHGPGISQVTAPGSAAAAAASEAAREIRLAAGGEAEETDGPARSRTADEAADPGDLAPSNTAGLAAPLMAAQAGAAGAASGRMVMIPEHVQRFLEYAAVTRNREGTVEFRLGLRQDVAGGLGVRIAAYGNRRVGLRITARDQSALSDVEVQSLVDALKDRGVEVVEVVVG